MSLSENMPLSAPRVLITSFANSEVSAEIPFLLKRAGCFVGIYSLKDSWMLKNAYWNEWHPAGETPETFGEELYALLRREKYDWVICGDDDSLRVVEDSVPDDLAPQIIPLSKLEHRGLIGSKAGLSRILDRCSIPTPPFAIYRGGTGAEEAEEVSFPLLLKVDRSGGGRGIFLCKNQDDVAEALKRLPFSKKQNLVFQKYIAGDNISVEALYRKGELIMYAASHVLSTLGNEFSVSSSRRYGRYSELQELLRTIGKSLGFHGFCSFTFMREAATGTYYLVEADLRTHAWFSYSRFAGADFSLGIRRFLGEKDIRFLPWAQDAELRYPLRDINRSLVERDWKNIGAWIFNTDGRWKLLPWHDYRMMKAVLGRLFSMRLYRLRIFVQEIGKKTGVLWTYLRYYRKEKKRVLLSILLSIVQTAALVPIPLAAQNVFEGGLIGGEAWDLVLPLMLLGLLFIATSLLGLLNRYLTLRVSRSLVFGIRRDLLFRAIGFERRLAIGEDLDGVHSRIVHDTERMTRIMGTLLAQAFPNILISLGLVCVLFYLNPLLALVMMAVIPPLYFLGRTVGKRVRRSVRVFHASFSEFSKGVSFVLKFNELIALSSAEAQELERQEKRMEAVQVSGERVAWLSAVYSTIQGALLILGGLLVLSIGGVQVAEGSTTIGALLSFYVALNMLTSSARGVMGTVPVFIEGAESFASLEPLLSLPGAPKRPGRQFGGLRNEIVFEKVSFGYKESEPILEDVSFVLPKGAVAGIFGSSGSGKTTLVNLLLGLHAPVSGGVFIDGEDLRVFDVPSYRRVFGVLAQEPLIFPGTIRENLMYGLLKTDEAQMIEAARIARIHEHIIALPSGYDSEMGNRGGYLSGGQKQRIAIARALLRNPEILILDEPDNNLDDALIQSIVADIKRLGITVIIISHSKTLQTLVDIPLFIQNRTVVRESLVH